MSIDALHSDLEAIYAAVAEGRPVDIEVKKRIQERAEKARQDVFRRHGYLNIAVESIREIRE